MFKKTLVALTAVAGMLSAGASVAGAVFNDFKVNPAPYSTEPFLVSAGLGQQAFWADKMTGNYVEVVSFDGAGNFAVSLKVNIGQFVANDGVDPVAATTSGLGLGYGLYALFQGTGTVSTVAGKSTFNLSSGSLGFWLDNNVLAGATTFTAPGNGAGAWTLGNNADDILLASGVAVSGSGLLDPSLSTCGDDGINCGSFGQKTTFALTDPEGKSFFVAPTPFFDLSFQSGQLNNFEPAGTQTINGSMDITFGNRVPEPASLALVGLALAGAGFARRRRA